MLSVLLTVSAVMLLSKVCRTTLLVLLLMSFTRLFMYSPFSGDISMSLVLAHAAHISYSFSEITYDSSQFDLLNKYYGRAGARVYVASHSLEV